MFVNVLSMQETDKVDGLPLQVFEQGDVRVDIFDVGAFVIEKVLEGADANN